jgi:glycosyltransferase involved in cell wall biosynthesis
VRAAIAEAGIIIALAVISVVIPAYNEQERLPATLETILAHLRKGDWSGFEILVVDDGSTDGTRAVVERYQRSYPEIHLLANPGNRGKGFSVRHGMLRAEGNWALFTDADLSAPIEELDKLLAAVKERQADIAIGSRALDRSLIGVHQSFFREQAGRVFNLMMRILVGLPFWDTQCGFKLFSARAAREVFRRVRLERFGFDVEALFIGRKLGFRTVEVPVRWDHVEGTKVSMWKDSMHMFLDLIRVRTNQFRGLYQ